MTEENYEEFLEVFSNPVHFSNGSTLILREGHPELALQFLSEELDLDLTIHDLTEGKVIFGPVSDNIEGFDEGEECWHITENTIKGGFPVWIVA